MMDDFFFCLSFLLGCNTTREGQGPLLVPSVVLAWHMTIFTDYALGTNEGQVLHWNLEPVSERPS